MGSNSTFLFPTPAPCRIDQQVVYTSCAYVPLTGIRAYVERERDAYILYMRICVIFQNKKLISESKNFLFYTKVFYLLWDLRSDLALFSRIIQTKIP